MKGNVMTSKNDIIEMQKSKRKAEMKKCQSVLDTLSKELGEGNAPDPKEVAKICRKIEEANGFDGARKDGLLPKLMLVVTELDEGMEFYKGHPGDPLHEELADAAIRLFATIHDWTLGKWNWRYEKMKDRPIRVKMTPLEIHVWKIVHYLCLAAEHWRHGQQADTNISLELAVARIFSVGDILGYNLWVHILEKCYVNTTRPFRHGKKESA